MSRTLRVIIAKDQLRVDIEAGSECSETDDATRAILEILGVRLDGVTDVTAPKPAQAEVAPLKTRMRQGG